MELASGAGSQPTSRLPPRNRSGIGFWLEGLGFPAAEMRFLSFDRHHVVVRQRRLAQSGGQRGEAAVDVLVSEQGPSFGERLEERRVGEERRYRWSPDQ